MKDVRKMSLLGGVGSLLILLILVPVVGAVLAIVGFILVILAVYYFSKAAKSMQIFRDYLVSVIILAVGIAIAIIYALSALFTPSVIKLLQMVSNTTNSTSTTSATTVATLTQTIGIPLLIAAIILIATAIISTVYLRRSFKSLAIKSGVKLFDTASLLYFIGAVLIIVFGIGLLVIFVALILQVIAFFSLKKIPAKRRH
jgi:uncharacterized membrane protein